MKSTKMKLISAFVSLASVTDPVFYVANGKVVNFRNLSKSSKVSALKVNSPRKEQVVSSKKPSSVNAGTSSPKRGKVRKLNNNSKPRNVSFGMKGTAMVAAPIGVFGLGLLIYLKGKKSKIKNCFDGVSLESYIKDAKIPDVVKELNNKFSSKIKTARFSDLNSLSSSRSVSNKKSGRTEVEKALDEAVEKGVVPIKSFSVKELKDYFDGLVKSNGTNGNPKYSLEKRIDAFKLYESAKDGAIVQVASQFNALESVNSNFSPVLNWSSDKTQGPMASLQAVISAKHRESAYLAGKLPDSLLPAFNDDELKDYRLDVNKFYKGGYFEPWKVNLTAAIDGSIDIDCLGINMQWVLCANGKKQLQVFAAAPSFQGHSVNWSDLFRKTGYELNRISFMYRVCERLLVAQYEAIARIAVIDSILNKKRSELHLTQVGIVSFGNPSDLMKDCLKGVSDIVKGHDVDVILHAYDEEAKVNWKVAVKFAELKEVKGFD